MEDASFYFGLKNIAWKFKGFDFQGFLSGQGFNSILIYCNSDNLKLSLLLLLVLIFPSVD